MPCYHPIDAWRDHQGGINFRQVNDSQFIALPCGQCIGCRLTHSRTWAIRCMHEAKMNRYNSFLTLTISDEYLTQRYWTGLYYENGQKAYGGTLTTDDHQNFFKRLRKHIGYSSTAAYTKGILTANFPPTNPPVGGGEILTSTSTAHHNGASVAPQKAVARQTPLSYYMAGEYGAKFKRPHYHICLFGVDFADKQYFRKSPTGAKLYRSTTLEKLWPYGFSTIGAVTFESAAYVARYIMKKQNGVNAEKHYEVIDHDTGELLRLKPEAPYMSRAEGIGTKWLDKYLADVYPQGKVLIRNHQTNAPRFYDKLYKRIAPHEYADLKLEREMAARGNYLELTPERLQVREQVQAAQLKQLKRKIAL